MGRAFLEVSHDMLAHMFALPPGWKVVGTWPSDPPDFRELPHIQLDVKVEYHPQDPTFKKITTIPGIQPTSGKKP